ncbi:YhcH/YjgK/YiaL family protein [Paenibacillus contaminans]|uniref:YhcH/YjgK/YiaL family protein n=1 Tax=Paenibacillus contaminans TaxID=450362 RepID=A0A329M9Y0_9BACL|nr:YhcH/YjgK/YiaL family protein [Paenibacillus contaminans]RAV16660.1 YhcH/YjgK/YiaL family protein [Paenibacillus contaminans]
MIIDRLENASLYYGVSENIKKALEYLEQTDFSAMEPGNYEIEGENMYAMLQHYVNRPIEEGVWEAHRKYIDVHYIYEGMERMGYASVSNLKLIKEYDEKDDYSFYVGKGSWNVFDEGSFVIYGLQDAHIPAIAVNEPQAVKKVIVKIKA